MNIIKTLKEFGIYFGCVLLICSIWFLAGNYSTMDVYGCSIMEQYKAYDLVKDNVESLMYDDWKIIDFKAEKVEKISGWYEVYVEVANDNYGEWSNGFVSFNDKGEIIKETLTPYMRYYDRRHEKKTKLNIVARDL